MRIATGIIGLVLWNTALTAQMPREFAAWDAEVIAAANTARDVRYMNADEKMVILYSNLARADGPLFARTFLKQYLELKNMDPTPYTMSLQRDLQAVKNLPMLKPEKDLYNAARDHAIRSGKRGFKGHKGFKNRMGPLMVKYRLVGENIYYGEYTPIEIVLQLLIDEGIRDLGHRHNLLNTDFNSIGVCIKPHKTHQYNCVQVFGKLPRSYMDYIQ